jgi:lysophospholipase L1-like esterase
MIKKMLKWPMHVVALTTLGLLLLLSGCGSSSKYDEFFPTRIVSIGDFLSYQGTPSNGYSDKLTVNDLTVNNWVTQLATSYNITFDPSLTAFATPNATVADLPKQLSKFVPQLGDMLVINSGMNDILNHTKAVLNKTETPEQAIAALGALGTTYQLFARDQLKNFAHILILNAYDLKGSPFAQKNAAKFSSLWPNYPGGLSQFIQDETRNFNNKIISNAGTYVSGQGVRLFDAEVLYLSADFQGYGITTAGLTLAACPVIMAGINCTATSADPNYNNYLYADDVNVTPVAQRLLGAYAYTFLRSAKGW